MQGSGFIKNMNKSFSNRSFFSTSNKEKLYLVIVLSVIAAVYFLTSSVNHNEAEDSLCYLYKISYGSLSDQFHPEHLLYNFINYKFFQLWQLFGYKGNAEFTVKFVNIIAALSALWLLYVIASKLNFPVLLRYLCIISVAFSYGFWWYSVECETYIIPIVFVLLCLHRLILIHKDFFKLANHLFLGAFNAIAILFHKQHILLVIIIFLGYILIFYENRRRITWNKFTVIITMYTAICGFMVLFSYLIVAIFIKGLFNFNQIAIWVLHLDVVSSKLGWHISDLPKAIIGFCRIFIGGHYIFSFSIFSDLLQKIMPFFWLEEEIFLIKDFSIFRSVSLYVLSIVVFLLTIYIIFQINKHRSLPLMRSSESDLSRLKFFIIIILSGYFVIYSLFNMFYVPQNIEMWISLSPIVFLALGLLTIPIIHKTRNRISMGIILICLFLINLFGSVLPQTDPEHDYWHKFNSWLIKNCNAGDLVVSGSGTISDRYVKYYSGAEVFSTLYSDQSLEKEFQEIIASHKTKKIYFSSTVLHPIKEFTGDNFDNSYTTSFFSKSTKYLTLIHSDSYQKVFLYKSDKK